MHSTTIRRLADSPRPAAFRHGSGKPAVAHELSNALTVMRTYTYFAWQRGIERVLLEAKQARQARAESALEIGSQAIHDG